MLATIIATAAIASLPLSIALSYLVVRLIRKSRKLQELIDIKDLELAMYINRINTETKKLHKTQTSTRSRRRREVQQPRDFDHNPMVA